MEGEKLREADTYSFSAMPGCALHVEAAEAAASPATEASTPVTHHSKGIP